MMGPGPGGGGSRFYRETDEKTQITWEKTKQVFSYFIPYRVQLVILFFAVLVSSGLGVVPPILTRIIIDNALPNKDINLLLTLIPLSFSVIVIMQLIDVGQSYLNSIITQNIIKNLRQKMYDHLQRMSIQFFTNIKTGDILSRMNNDIGGIERIFAETFISIVRNLFIFSTTAITLFSTNWIMALVSIVILPVFIVPTKKVGKKRWYLAKDTQEHLSAVNSIITETLHVGGATLVKLFTKEKVESDRFATENDTVARLKIREQLVGRWFFMFIRVFTTIGPLLIYLVGGLLLIINGSMTIGSMVMFVSLLGRLYGPITSFTNLHVDITRSFALFDRIFEYFDTPYDIVEQTNANSVDSLTGNISFQNVFFSYRMENNINDNCNSSHEHKVKPAMTLRNINIDIREGETVAFVGPSGAGKTTITNLIPRLYDVTGGAIHIGGIDIRQLTLHSLRRNISMVTQDTFLFNATIMMNLEYACNDASINKIEAACEAAYIHDFINTLPGGYHTLVGERGVKLSGGEKQRISIARAILKNPDIVILDEATSALDSASEKYIQMAMEPLLRDKTSLIIAHRLSTILNADRIFVVDNGTIVQQGTHLELLKEDALYRKLYDTQFQLVET